jgi:hypothetical protein
VLCCVVLCCVVLCCVVLCCVCVCVCVSVCVDVCVLCVVCVVLYCVVLCCVVSCCVVSCCVVSAYTAAMDKRHVSRHVARRLPAGGLLFNGISIPVGDCAVVQIGLTSGQNDEAICLDTYIVHRKTGAHLCRGPSHLHWLALGERYALRASDMHLRGLQSVSD